MRVYITCQVNNNGVNKLGLTSNPTVKSPTFPTATSLNSLGFLPRGRKTSGRQNWMSYLLIELKHTAFHDVRPCAASIIRQDCTAPWPTRQCSWKSTPWQPDFQSSCFWSRSASSSQSITLGFDNARRTSYLLANLMEKTHWSCQNTSVHHCICHFPFADIG